MKVSVVTPFFNTAPYLDECISSVRAQTFEDFEYLLVDNCSTDESLAIATRHAMQDRRIRLVRNDVFLSQVANYNRALQLICSTSCFCKVVQADDWLNRRCLEEMVALGEANPQVGLISSYRMVGRMVAGSGLPYTAQVLDGRTVCREQLLDGRFYFGSPTTVMYRADLVRARKPFYEEGRLHEDTEVCYELLSETSFGFVHQVLSYSRVDNESVMSRARRFDGQILDHLIVLHRFGPEFLEVKEQRVCWRRSESEYLRFLARALLQRRGDGFWDYHRRGLATIGYTIHRPRLMGLACLHLLDMALNPKSTLTALARSVASRLMLRPTSSQHSIQ